MTPIQNNQETQQKYVELQMLMQQLQQLHQQSQVIEQQFIELKHIEDNLNNLEKTKPNTNSFSSIGAGIFVESQLKDTQKVLMNIGSQTAVKKTIPEAKKLVQHQQHQVEDILVNLEKQIHQTTTKAQEIELKIQKS